MVKVGFKRKWLLLLLVIFGCVLTGITVALKLRSTGDDAAEEKKLAEAYVQLRRAVENQDYDLAYSLMSEDYKSVVNRDAFEQFATRLTTRLPPFNDNSEVRVRGNVGEVQVAIGGDEFWARLWFTNENGHWRFTDKKDRVARGLFP